MPLTKGKSKRVVSKNIGELMNAYKSKGKIGTSTPESDRAARAQAIAISMKKAGKSKKY